MNLVSTILVALFAIVATPQQSKPDVKGSSDYPMFANRMPGYRISSYEKQGFSSYRFNTKPPQTIEGRYLRIGYYLDSGENPGELAIIRNYQNAAKSAGAQILPGIHSGYSIFKVTREGAEVWIEAHTINQREYCMTIIECAPMQQVIRADAMAAALDKEGFVALDIHLPPRWMLHPQPIGLDGEEIETGCELKGLALRRTYG